MAGALFKAVVVIGIDVIGSDIVIGIDVKLKGTHKKTKKKKLKKKEKEKFGDDNAHFMYHYCPLTDMF